MEASFTCILTIYKPFTKVSNLYCIFKDKDKMRVKCMIYIYMYVNTIIHYYINTIYTTKRIG